MSASRPARLDPENLRPDLRDALAPRIERLGYLGEFFRCAAHQPDALLSLMAFTEQLRAALPGRLGEVVPLTVSVVTGNDYERVQHERLSLQLGYGEAWVRAVEACDPDSAAAAELGDDERTTQGLVLAALERFGRGSRERFEVLAEAAGDEVAMAALLLTGRYVLHALTVNALELDPPVASPFDA